MKNAIFLLSVLMIFISFATTVSGLECPSGNIDCEYPVCGNIIETGAGGGWGVPYLELLGGGDSGVFGYFCGQYAPPIAVDTCKSNLSRKMTFTTDYTGDYHAIPVYLFANMSGAGEERPMLIAGNCFFVYWGLGCTSEFIGSSKCTRCIMAESGVRGRFVQIDTSFIGDHINIISGTVVSMDNPDTSSDILAIKQQYERNPYAAYRLDTLKFSFVMGDGSTRKVNISIPEQCIPYLAPRLRTCANDDDCPAGEACAGGACYEQVECIGSESCPTGEACVNNACVKALPKPPIQPNKPTGKVQMVSGTAEIIHADGTTSPLASQTISVGDVIRAGEDGAIFTLEDGSRITLALGTEIMFNGTGVIDLLDGGIEYARAAAGQNLEIRTDRGIAMINGGEFIIFNWDNQTTVFSHGGMMEFTPLKDGIRLPNETKTIEPSQMLFIDSNHTATIMPRSEEDWSEMGSLFEGTAQAENITTETGSEGQTSKTSAPMCLGGFVIAGTGAWAYLSGRKQRKR